LVNPGQPGRKISYVPGVTADNTGNDTFGAASSKFWLEAYGPTLQAQPWTWPLAESTPGEPINVPVGQDVGATQAQLTALGFRSTVAKYTCGSDVFAGNVAYYSPKIGIPGNGAGSTVVTLCPSSGVPTSVYVPPVVKVPTKTPGSSAPKPTPKPTPRRRGGG
jgi:hypothetical protein